jgi:hypothetical protein
MATEVQIGDVFMKTTVSIGSGAMTRTRVIRPVMDKAMVRFDLDVNIMRGTVEVHNIFFYKRGDKLAEKRALEGED